MQTATLNSPTSSTVGSAGPRASALHQVFDPQSIAALDWKPYGADGRRNVMIHRLYDARHNGSGPAAALLKYAPGASVPTHLHVGYELILVLEGELINDAGRHGPGTLEICPPGSTHALASDKGCTFLVVWEQPVTLLA
jgi:anti-sigma factor ChrR (cupin superfamily)